ncbi:hypothetical protein Hbl1158_07755 [Halobaculum sp. CBA1158]|uniref:hypothetical protein n=1 Tax=Halobaculum sp. CBA1158 TaxID=2904243 RepID=UPI001F4262BB|nr:hypothetical protein [Halobaculum sp. CBA1158]UIO98460.1 hypothetical protein Hbl1158_07755 [Halobaculum sp. CBA1158]
MILGLVLGYIFLMLGFTLFFDLNGIEGISDVEAAIVGATGVGSVVVGYVGWKGFMEFAY